MKKVYESPEVQSMRFVFPEDIADTAPGYGDANVPASTIWGE